MKIESAETVAAAKPMPRILFVKNNSS